MTELEREVLITVAKLTAENTVNWFTDNERHAAYLRKSELYKRLTNLVTMLENEPTR